MQHRHSCTEWCKTGLNFCYTPSRAIQGHFWDPYPPEPTLTIVMKPSQQNGRCSATVTIYDIVTNRNNNSRLLHACWYNIRLKHVQLTSACIISTPTQHGTPTCDKAIITRARSDRILTQSPPYDSYTDYSIDNGASIKMSRDKFCIGIS